MTYVITTLHPNEYKNAGVFEKKWNKKCKCTCKECEKTETLSTLGHIPVAGLKNVIKIKHLANIRFLAENGNIDNIAFLCNHNISVEIDNLSNTLKKIDELCQKYEHYIFCYFGDVEKAIIDKKNKASLRFQILPINNLGENKNWEILKKEIMLLKEV